MSTLPAAVQDRGSDHPVHKTLASAANLANLLPTSTVLAFNALIPPFSNNGSCELSNKFLTSLVIFISAIICFLSSFTDSFISSDGKLYHGIATFNGLYVFNYSNDEETKELCKFRIRVIDFVHAFLSLLLFLVFAVSNSNVQNCLIPNEGTNERALIMNLPLGAGILSSFLFAYFPTTRRGIGYADMPSS
ncbi:protein DMP3 [Gastrolobium bilobum]|uniref:protein DMP3 n=1 Tax=Gastrolobium bilobum TaxID=150636 RepID=UPI002AB1F4F8|nr:protein DMP3 [Gastrolobium bilobum]